MKNVNPFIGKQIRAVQAPETQVWWFSAIDICAVLIDSDYDTAAAYWHLQKHRWQIEGHQLLAKCNKLKMKSRDRKMRFTDVLDMTQVLYLIQIIPSAAAEPFRLWLAEMAAVGSAAAEQLIAVGEMNKGIVLGEIEAVKGKPYEIMTVTRRRIPLDGGGD